MDLFRKLLHHTLLVHIGNNLNYGGHDKPIVATAIIV